ncbi:hypothetical protein [Shouchella patagoniensis]|uniref:hypothetical protein n=1 Tax=Shouchella patagoniensis TaxID=228576 RepID=UPI001474580C|nr:hypothetical protein [Shouchella patagoniensis]
MMKTVLRQSWPFLAIAVTFFLVVGFSQSDGLTEEERQAIEIELLKVELDND